MLHAPLHVLNSFEKTNLHKLIMSLGEIVAYSPLAVLEELRVLSFVKIMHLPILYWLDTSRYQHFEYNYKAL